MDHTVRVTASDQEDILDALERHLIWVFDPIWNDRERRETTIPVTVHVESKGADPRGAIKKLFASKFTIEAGTRLRGVDR